MKQKTLAVASQVALGDWLNSFEWHYWCTFTTRSQMTLKSARRMAQGMDKYLSGAYHWQMFWCAEPFDVKEGHHLHALIRMSDTRSFDKIRCTWQIVSGNTSLEKGEKWNGCLVEMYDKKLGAGHYVSKYITKQLSDYDFYTKETSIKF